MARQALDVPMHLQVDGVHRSRVPLKAWWMSDVVLVELVQAAQSLMMAHRALNAPLHLLVDDLPRSTVPLEAYWLSDVPVVDFPSPTQSARWTCLSVLGVQCPRSAQYLGRHSLSIVGVHRKGRGELIHDFGLR